MPMSSRIERHGRRTGTVHLCPIAGSAVAACCGAMVLALPENDRVSDDVEAVTCGSISGSRRAPGEASVPISRG